MADLKFIQMSGAPGSGKTTMARVIAQHTGAVVIDHDVTKSALLEADVPASSAGHASYMVLDALARNLLQQGQSVIFDSPCFYDELLKRGQDAASEADAAYRYIECRVEHLDELDRRLRTRLRLPSQIVGVYMPSTAGSGKAQVDEAVFRDWIANMKRPDSPYLILDMTRPLPVCLDEALAYIETGRITSGGR